MDSLFAYKLLLAFGGGGIMVTLATVAAERLGSRVGGFLGGLPAMVAISLFFIGYAQSPQAASEATGAIPLIMGINAVFLVVYAALSRWGLWAGMGAGFLVWLILASLVIFLNFTHFAWAFLIFALLLFGSYQMLDKVWRLRSAGSVSIRYTAVQILSRALFSGTVASAAVFLSKAGGPVWGGVMAPFPVIYLSTLFILARSRGVAYSLAIAKPMLVSSMVNVVVYALAVRHGYPAFGLAKGTLLALAASAISAWGTYSLTKRMT